MSSFAALCADFAPVHHSLSHDSYAAAIASCDDLLTQLQHLQTALKASPTSSPPTITPTSSSPPSNPPLTALSSRLLSSLTHAKATHTRAFKQLHSRTQTFARSLDRTLAHALDPSTLHPASFPPALVNEEVGRTLEREGLVDVARELKRECGGAWEVDDGMMRMHEVRQRMEEGRDVAPCLEWVVEETANVKGMLEQLMRAKAQAEVGGSEIEGGGRRGKGRAGADRMVDEEEEGDRVGLALPMFPLSPTTSVRSAARSLATQLSALQSLHEELHALHFDLHRIRFLQLLTAPSTPSTTSDPSAPSPSPTTNGQAALLYAQTHFGLFAEERIEDIRKLSGLLLFYPNLTPSSPYANLFTPPTSPTSTSPTTSPASAPSTLSTHLSAAAAAFCSLYLRLRSLPPSPPLLTLLTAASLAHPQLAHYQSLRMPSSHSLELDLTSLPPFHSTFICPVTREPSHSTNEPVMLPCGHLISTIAMDKIVRTLRMTRKFKCPTCPREQTPQDVLTVKL